MKNKQLMSLLSVVFFMMTLVLVLLSWIGSMYGWHSVQSILSEEGIRWVLNHAINDYVQTPALGIVLVLFMGIGVGIRAGFYNVCRRMFAREGYVSGKERRSFTFSSVVALCYVLTILSFIPFLRSVTGSLLHSPFQQGFFYILSFGLGLVGVVYGYASNNYRQVNQVFEGMASLISRVAHYFITLFFVVQFFSVLNYTQLLQTVGVSNSTVDILFTICCYLPLLICCFKYQSSRLA